MFPPIIKLCVRLPILIIFVVVCLPVQIILHMTGWRIKSILPVLTFRLVLFLASIKRRVHGPKPERGTLILSNHVSWLDIVLIGATVPVNFVSKDDIARWPLFGLLARVAGTIFISRKKVGETMKQKNAMQKKLAAGERVVLFAEGSTGNGTIVLPFKSSLLAAAETPEDKKPIKIQPMTLVFSKLRGLPMSRRMRIEYAWVGHLSLVPHMLKVLAGPPIRVDLIFHPPTDLASHKGRKELAKAAHAQVQSGLAAFTVGTHEAFSHIGSSE